MAASRRECGGVFGISGIIPNHLYLSGYRVTTSWSLLTKFGIGAVVNLAGTKNPFPDRLSYLNLEVVDDEKCNILQHFDAALDFMRDHHAKFRDLAPQAPRATSEETGEDAREGVQAAARPGVLVHCMRGVSRSATIVVAYLMREVGMPLRNALWFTFERHDRIWPNSGFVAQLCEYERKLVAAGDLECPDSDSDSEGDGESVPEYVFFTPEEFKVFRTRKEIALRTGDVIVADAAHALLESQGMCVVMAVEEYVSKGEKKE